MIESKFMDPLLLNTKKRLILSILSLGLFLVSALYSSAKAGDVSSRTVLGFSADGAYFAMEEYGVQDGSGFPYATIFLIDTKKNSWVKGSPFRVLIKDETATLEAAQQQARADAAALLEKYDIQSRGLLLAHNPVTELGSSRETVKVAPGTAPFLQQHALTFSVTPVALPTKRCKDYGDEAQQGYALTVQREGQGPQLLHKDKRIPTSRGCPKRYAISDVLRFVPKPDAKSALYIVILQRFSYGFEGDDGRYLISSHWLPSFLAQQAQK